MLGTKTTVLYSATRSCCNVDKKNVNCAQCQPHQHDRGVNLPHRTGTCRGSSSRRSPLSPPTARIPPPGKAAPCTGSVEHYTSSRTLPTHISPTPHQPHRMDGIDISVTRHAKSRTCPNPNLSAVPGPAQCLAQHSAWFSTVPGLAQCLPQHSAWFSTVPGSAQCLAQHSARFSKVPGSAQCLVQHSAWFSTLPGSAQCLPQYSAWFSAVPGSAQCLVQHSAWFSTVPGSAQCLVQHSAWLSTVPGPAQCLALHSARLSAVPGSAQCLA